MIYHQSPRPGPAPRVRPRAERAPDGELLGRLVEARRTAVRAAADQLVLALEFAHAHPVARGAEPARWDADQVALDADLHGERAVPLAGEGAPQVAEFAPYELAAALGFSADAGRSLVADALELGHRLPRVWAGVRALEIPAWRARALASATVRLSPEQANWADQVASTDRRVRLRLDSDSARRLADEAIVRFDPDAEAGIAEQEAARRFVRLDHRGLAPQTTRVEMLLDTVDALALDRTVGDVARVLGGLGDTRSMDVRRAASVGTLADPQRALDLLTGAPAQDQPDGAPAGSSRRPPAVLYLHLDAGELTTDGAAVSERLGGLARRTVQDWLGRVDLEIRPVFRVPVVLDAVDGAEPATDVHDPTDLIREHVVLADSTCVFPACTRDSRHTDLDHIESFVPVQDGGPPGQTRPSNLAPLCRRHHRMKTHLAWDYRRVAANSFAWTGPGGETYTVVTSRRRC